METVNLLRKKAERSLEIFLSFLILICLFSCQVQDELDPVESNEDVDLKTVVIPPPGPVPGVGLWDFTLPCDPSIWNTLEKRYILVFAHGMVFPEPYVPLAIPNDKLGGIYVKNIVTGLMGWAYATTSYENNGLVAVEAVQNIKNLVQLVKKYLRSENLMLPDYWILAGPSEGGLVTVLTLEKYPDLFDGGLTVCGPIGNFYNQLQYMGDFHVLFNYFFNYQGIGNPEDGVPTSVMEGWSYPPFPKKTEIIGLLANPLNYLKVVQFINCSKSNLNPLDPDKTGPALIHLLGYNVMLTNNVTGLLNGCIFKNNDRVYTGSLDDAALNENIQRVLTKDYQRAKSHVIPFETTGKIQVPLVSMHTTGDYLVPIWHQENYGTKVTSTGKSDLFYGMTINRFGHCEVTVPEIQTAIGILLSKM